MGMKENENTLDAAASRLLKISSSTTLVMSKRMIPERTELRTDSGKDLMVAIGEDGRLSSVTNAE